MRNIVIEKSEEALMDEKEIEIVERKGIGHPDSLCDLCCEKASQILSQYYLKKFDTVLHHNLDKGLLIAGVSKPKFGGGKIIRPFKIIIAGRATDEIGKNKIPVKKIVEEGVKNYLTKFTSKNNFEIFLDYEPGAANLKEIFERKRKIALANDTSFGASHFPFSQTEKVTLRVAQLINSQKTRKKFPFLGLDLKVMSLREGKNLNLILAVAYIDKYIKDTKDYFEKKEMVRKFVLNFVKRNFNFKNVNVFHNSADSIQAKSESEIYLTVTGFSAEHGDDGQVGRGNRVNGLITPFREMSMEAAAGKNINHPGKLYQILAFLISQKVARIKGIRECEVKILSEIGKPLDQPKVVHLKIWTKNEKGVKNKILEIVEKTFDNLRKIQIQIVKGKYAIC